MYQYLISCLIIVELVKIYSWNYAFLINLLGSWLTILGILIGLFPVLYFFVNVKLLTQLYLHDSLFSCSELTLQDFLSLHIDNQSKDRDIVLSQELKGKVYSSRKLSSGEMVNCVDYWKVFEMGAQNSSLPKNAKIFIYELAKWLPKKKDMEGVLSKLSIFQNYPSGYPEN
jgi:hypothetical protein